MNKISERDARLSTTFFLIDKGIEDDFDQQINHMANEMMKILQQINHKAGFIECIKNHKDAFNLIIALLGISQEKFKRVVSMLRASYGYTFESEWDLKAIRKNFLEDTRFQNDLCDLFLSDVNTSRFNTLLPQFYLNNFHIDYNSISRLANAGFLKKLAKDKLLLDYNNAYCEHYRKLIVAYIKELANKYKIGYKQDTYANSYDDLISKNHSFQVIELYCEKTLVIAPNFYYTTAPTQDKIAKNVYEPLYKVLKSKNITLINMLDGAGWIGRSASYRTIYNNCHYFLNLKNINLIEELINE